MFWCVFPFSWKVNFWLREKYLPQFLTYKVETHIIFKMAQKTIFHLFAEKIHKTTNDFVKTQNFEKIFFYILFFKNSKNGLFCAMHLAFVNEIKISILLYLWNCSRTSSFFHRAPKKLIFSMQIIFFTYYGKSLETNYVWDLRIKLFV